LLEITDFFLIFLGQSLQILTPDTLSDCFVLSYEFFAQRIC